MPEEDLRHLLPISVFITRTEFLHEVRITKPEFDVTRASALEELANGNQPVKIARVALSEAVMNEGDLLGLIHGDIVRSKKADAR
jgi:hypothetical protein